MSVINDIGRQLVRRRLWPVALLLVAALAAVPMLLAENPAPVAAPAPAPQADAAAADQAATGEPIVALAGVEDRDRRRRVLGARKNPFQPVVVPTPEPEEAKAPESTTPKPDTPSTGGSTAPSGGSGVTAPPSTPAPSLPTVPSLPVTPTEPEKTYPVNSLIVRFGDAVSGSLERMNLERLEPLPSPEEPVLVYLGLTKDRKSAIFMVDAAAEVTGDGRCQPHPSSCETIELSKGETEFFDVKDESGTVVDQFQLDLVDIKARKATANQARAAYAEESRKGRRALNARIARRGPLHWDYDRKTGTLRRLDREAYTAKVARVEGVLAPAS